LHSSAERNTVRYVIETPTYRMADRLAQGTLAEQMLALRAAGLSYHQISRRLFADHGIEVTAPTVTIWLAQLEQEAAA